MSEIIYREHYRPQFHYTSARGHINDPVGLVYYRGEYHLFNDFNPASCRFPFGLTDGEQSHWSHAVSKDLVHWDPMPIALYPEKDAACFSGSGLVDWNNDTGFQTGPEPPMILMYTSAGAVFGQHLAFSNDRGRTWTKYSDNPVLDQVAERNRDPKVFRHIPSNRWVMVLYVKPGYAHFYSSVDVKSWRYESEIELDGFNECPDLFELPVDGDAGNTRWILHDARFQYWIGEFDGRIFTPESGPLQGDFGSNFFASQSWSDVGGRRIQIGWMNGGRYPGMPFNQQMSISRELSLHSTAAGLRLFINPVRELSCLRTEGVELSELNVGPGLTSFEAGAHDLYDVELEVADLKDTIFQLCFGDICISYHGNSVYCLGKGMTLAGDGSSIKLRVLLDRTSIEIFANDGASVISSCFLPAPVDMQPTFFLGRGTATIKSIKIYPLQSIWKGFSSV